VHTTLLKIACNQIYAVPANQFSPSAGTTLLLETNVGSFYLFYDSFCFSEFLLAAFQVFCISMATVMGPASAA